MNKLNNFEFNFLLFSLIGLTLILLKINIFFFFYYSLAMLGVMYIVLKEKTSYSLQYIYVSFFYFIISSIFVYINFADILAYQDQYFYVNQSLGLISSNSYFQIIDDFFLVPSYLRFNNWTFVHFVNDYIFQDKRAILFFNFLFHFLTVIYVWKSFKYLFHNKNVQLYFFITMLFSFPLLFVNSLYLKESFYGSLLILLLTSIKNKNIFLIIFSSFFLIKIRTSYFILLVLLSLFFRIIFSVNKKIKILILVISIGIGCFGITYISSLDNTRIKLIDYFNQSKEGKNLTIYELENFALNFVDKENLLSVQNIVILPIVGLFSPPPVRFLKTTDLRTFLESIMVSLWWWVGLPFFIIFVIGFFKIDYKLTAYIMGIFLSIYLGSSFSLISIAPEIFRYRLPIFNMFIFGSFIGYYFYTLNKRYLYKKIVKIWFYGSSALYIIYMLV
ncbi:hypothetical protein [Aliarcobacter cryaerophilus]|uniref:hypothetical protein n=1 Tax=Aliarcobacter cryaerophilus TaxID=28198 RepID=UPI0021B6330C|nr:hypothetical protein [Aliarcobacter cryaerophilus]MCT7517022.1 hypothetical protein [Aliarcobacter cryaerophilus]